MAACQDGGQYTAEHIVLAQDGFACLSENGVYGFFGIHEGLLYLYPILIPYYYTTIGEGGCGTSV